MLRESNMNAILIEDEYIDFIIDIKKMRNDKVLEASGKAVADSVTDYFGIKVKLFMPVENPEEENDIKELEELKKDLTVLKKHYVTRKQLATVLTRKQI